MGFYAKEQLSISEHSNDVGWGAYAIKAARASAPDGQTEEAGRRECEWQRFNFQAKSVISY